MRSVGEAGGRRRCGAYETARRLPTGRKDDRNGGEPGATAVRKGGNVKSGAREDTHSGLKVLTAVFVGFLVPALAHADIISPDDGALGSNRDRRRP